MTAGLMTYGGEIFDPYSAGFAAYILYGMSTAFIFAFYHVRGLANAITTAFLTGLAIFVIAWSLMPALNAAIWSFGVNLSVIIPAFLFERKLAQFKQWRFIFIGVIYGSVFVLLTLLVDVITKVEALPPSLFQKNYLDGLWLGLSLGVGVEVAESIIHSVDLHKQAKKEPTK
jgi:sulfite exporter TauE/SafE